MVTGDIWGACRQHGIPPSSIDIRPAEECGEQGVR